MSLVEQAAGTSSGVSCGDMEEELLRADARPEEAKEDEDEGWTGLLLIVVKGIGAPGDSDIGWVVGKAILAYCHCLRGKAVRGGCK